MTIITKTEGHYIINSAAVSLNGTVVSYRDDATVREFSSEAEMLAIHQHLYPDQYETEEEEVAPE